MPGLSPEDITRVRKELGYTLDEFAELLDVSMETVRSWEGGRRGCKGPAALLIRMICDYPKVHKILKNL